MIHTVVYDIFATLLYCESNTHVFQFIFFFRRSVMRVVLIFRRPFAVWLKYLLLLFATLRLIELSLWNEETAFCTVHTLER